MALCGEECTERALPTARNNIIFWHSRLIAVGYLGISMTLSRIRGSVVNQVNQVNQALVPTEASKVFSEISECLSESVGMQIRTRMRIPPN